MLDALTLDQLRVFVAVADAGSFRAAASRLTRAQSAISHAVANLEGQLAVTLFDRSGHRPRLTPEGEALLGDARAAILKVEAMRARAQGLGQGVESRLVVTFDNLFPLADVAAAFRALGDAFPAVELEMRVSPLGGPVVDLLDGNCTVGILTSDDFRNPRIGFDSLGSIRMVPAASADHPLGKAAREGRLSAELLREHHQIVLRDPTPLSAGREFHVLSPLRCYVNSQEAKREMILAGTGWGRLPDWSIQRELKAAELVPLDLRAIGLGGQELYHSYVAHCIDRPMGPVAMAFRTAIRRQIAER